MEEKSQPLQQDFAKAKEVLSQNWYVKTVTAVLGAVRETLLKMQDEGAEVSLDMRLTGIDTFPYAKGALVYDGIALDLFVTRDTSNADPLQLKVSLDGRTVAKLDVDPRTPENLLSFSKGLRLTLLKIKAGAEIYADFSIDDGAASRFKSVKPAAAKLNT